MGVEALREDPVSVKKLAPPLPRTYLLPLETAVVNLPLGGARSASRPKTIFVTRYAAYRHSGHP